MKLGRMWQIFPVLVVLAQVAGCLPAGKNAVPAITTLSPSSAPAGAAAQTLTINGVNFLSNSTASFNGASHSTTFVNASQLTISLTAPELATVGSYSVIVTNPAPGGGASNSVNFAVNFPAPVITGLSPSSVTAGAAAQTLTINGTGFASTATVTFNGTARAATFVNANHLTIALTVGDQATVGSYPVVVTNPSPSGPSNAFGFNVTSSVSLESSKPSNATGVLIQGTAVTAYVPNASWETSTTGLQVVPLEPTPVAAPASIATPGAVNSCASNSVTGETVCIANDTDVYLITGSTLNNTLTSGSNALAPFSDGQCNNCNVGINAVNNTAIMSMGLTGAASGTGLQILNLANNTFSAPFPVTNFLSEGVQVDPTRNLILSPSESGNYDLLEAGVPITEFANAVSGSPQFDSAAEDYTTGIALGTDEFTSNVYITDLTQATLTPGSPTGTWTAPGQLVAFPEFAGFSHGTCGISGVPGFHLAIVVGEDGGNQFGVLQLPSTSGTGTPAFVDYAAATMPNTPDSHPYSQGTEPHQVTSYTSPNSGKPYGLLVGAPPNYVAVIDLQALLAAPRTTGTHTVDPTYDLIAHGVVRYVSTH